MKIASKLLSLSSTALGFVLLFGVASASAEPSHPTEDTASTTTASNAPTPALAPEPAAPPAMAASSPSPSAAPVIPSGSSNRSKNLSAMEEKVSDSVKNVVKQLSSIDNVNLDDLNTARQAVVKLEVLIDIEKHLAELDKIHSERGGGEKSLAAAIPASALGMPAAMELPKIPVRSSHMMGESSAPAPVMARPDVSRISGADGHYTAVIGGKSLRTGDNLSDGSTIVGISAKEVTTKSKDGTVRQLKVKGVDEVFGSSL